MMFKRKRKDRKENSFESQVTEVRIPGVYSDASVWTKRKK